MVCGGVVFGSERFVALVAELLGCSRGSTFAGGRAFEFVHQLDAVISHTGTEK